MYEIFVVITYFKLYLNYNMAYFNLETVKPKSVAREYRAIIKCLCLKLTIMLKYL